MSSSFTVRSAAGVLVSLLNPVDISPMDSIHHDSGSVTPKKMHVCSVCYRSFSTMGHLNRHLTMHTGDKEHVCPFPGCGKGASRRDNLVQHYRMHLPRGEHNRCTSYIRSRMQNKMEEVGALPVRRARGRKDNNSLLYPGCSYHHSNPVRPAHHVSSPARRESVSSESSSSFSSGSPMSLSPSPEYRRPSTGSSISSASSPLVTPPSLYSEQDHYFAAHHLLPIRPPPSYKPMSYESDYSRNFKVSNVRGE